jgi:MGT family glycosyltransferase
MKFIMLVPEAHGHVNPTLPLAAELTAHGHEVVYFLPEAFAAVVRANGATLRPIAPLLEFPTDSSRSPFNLRQMAELTTEQQAAMTERIGRVQDRLRATLPELQGRIAAEAADCVIYDAYGFWLPDVARTIPGPKVAFFPTFAIPDGQVPRDTLAVAGRQFFPSAFLSLQTSLGFGSFFAEPFHAEDVNVVALPRAFQPNPDAFDDRYLFVGPSIRREGPIGDFPIEVLADRRVALVSLGTAASDAAFFDACFDAFAGSDWLVVAATGRTDPGTLRPLPDNVIARTHVPQLAVLERASVFVTHGGMNSTMEGLWYGVPLVVVPQHGDQPLVAERVATLGLGRTLMPEELSGAAVKEAVDAVIEDRQVAENVGRFQAEMREAGGAPRAAEVIERYAAHACEATPVLTI